MINSILFQGCRFDLDWPNNCCGCNNISILNLIRTWCMVDVCVNIILLVSQSRCFCSVLIEYTKSFHNKFSQEIYQEYVFLKLNPLRIWLINSYGLCKTSSRQFYSIFFPFRRSWWMLNWIWKIFMVYMTQNISKSCWRLIQMC